jgi:hypothetical protein
MNKFQPCKFTFIYLFLSKSPFEIQATTEAQAPVQQARVSPAHLS